MTEPIGRMPSATKLAPVVLKALEARGGVATIQQIEEFAVTDLGLTPEEASRPHGERREGGRTELSYRMAWARTKLRREGKIVNRSRGVWELSNG